MYLVGLEFLFLGTQKRCSPSQRVNAAIIFVAGMAGGLIAFLGQRLIDAQTGFWLVFGNWVGLYCR